jgi:hypothetical protein
MLIAQIVIVLSENSNGISDIGPSGGDRTHKASIINWYMVRSQASSSGFLLWSYIAISMATDLHLSILNFAKIV